MRTREPRSGLRTATAAGALAGLVLVAQQALPLVNVSMRTVFGLLAAVFVGVLGLLLSLQSAHRAEEAEREAQEREVDALLACWPAPKVRDANAYDLGARPSAGDGGEPPPYIPRSSADAELDERLRSASMTLLVGSSGAGKSRTLFEALKRTTPPARVLVPEDGGSLTELLALDPGRFLNGEAAVLWLDDVDRYLENLQLDGLDALWRHGVRVVGTIERERLLELSASSSEEGRLARRLLARTSLVTLPEELDAEEQAAAREAYPERDFSRGMASAFPLEWSRTGPPLYSPGPPAVRGPAPLRSDPAVVAAFVLVVALLGVLVVLVATDRALKPRPLTEQLASERRDAAGTCGRASVQPRGSDDAPDRSVFFVLRHADGCGESDELRVFEVRGGRLERAGTFEPRSPPNGFYRLQCRGQRRDAPCVVESASEHPAFVGAWMDTSLELMVPFVVHWTRGRYEVDALEVKRPVDPGEAPGAAREDRQRYADPIVIPAVEGDPIQGHAVEELALLQSGEMPRIARAFVWRGSWDVPRELEVIPKGLVLQPVPTLAPCTHARLPATQAGSGFVVRVPSRQGSLSRLLQETWTETEDSGNGTCNQ